MIVVLYYKVTEVFIVPLDASPVVLMFEKSPQDLKVLVSNTGGVGFVYCREMLHLD